jgi:bifunctional UDP-N-acetylglucosamine pyrophosphorylase/glucosamine-1-phosphate N-acetyltransferase
MLRLLDERRRAAAAVLVAGTRPADQAPYGRFILAPNRTLERIVEATDANTEERTIDLANGGIMMIEARHARDLIDALDRNNAKPESYLTDIAEIARRKGLSCRAIELPVEELIGVNSRPDLAKAEALMQRRLRRVAMDAGVTLVAPETVFMSADTTNVTFSPGVMVREAGVDPLVVISRSRQRRNRRSFRTVRAAAAGGDPRARNACRQFHRGQGSPPRRGRQGQSATARSAHAPISAPK